LGVLLYELLTGTTPLEKQRFRKVAFDEMLRIIREDEPQKPSTRLSTTDELPSISANRGLEPNKLSALVRGELDWIVMKALEKDRNRRYETANGFAVDIQRYLADEPVAACPPSAAYRLRKFARRNKGSLVTAALVTGALVAGMTVSIWQAIRATNALESDRRTRATLDTERNETERQKSRINRDLSDALAETTGLREQARAAGPVNSQNWAQAREAAERAQTLAGHELADPLLVQRAQTLLAGLKQDEIDRRTVAQLEELRLDRRFLYIPARLSPCLAVLRDYGLSVFDMEPEEASKRIASTSIRDAVVTALDDLSIRCDRDDERRLLSIAQKVSDEPWRKRYFDARLRHDKAALLELANEPETLRQPPSFIAYLVRALAEALLEGHDRHVASRLSTQALSMHPGDLWIVFESSRLIQRPEEQIAFLRISLALRPESPYLNYHLASLLQGAGQDEEAIAYFDRALRYKADDAGMVRTWRAISHGRLLERQGKLDEAIEAYRDGYRHESAITFSGRFELLDRLVDALERQGGAGAESIAALLPEYARANAGSYDLCLKQGDLLTRWGKIREAINCYAESIWLANPDVKAGEIKMFELLSKSGLLDETLATWRKNATENPGSLRVCRPLCALLEETGRLEECIAVWQRWDSGEDPTGYSRYNGWICFGDALTRAKRLTEAEAAYRKAVECAPGLMKAQRRLVEVAAKAAAERKAAPAKAAGEPESVVETIRAKSDWKEAIATCHKAIALQPHNFQLYRNLGVALALDANDGDEIAGCRKVVELYPQMAGAYFALGEALFNTDRAGAAAAYRKAIELDPNFEVAYLPLAAALVQRTASKEDLEEAVAVCSKAMEFDRTQAQRLRGRAYGKLAQWDKALTDFEEVIAVHPNDVDAWQSKGDVYSEMAQWDKAIAAHSRAVISKPAFPHVWIRRGRVCQMAGKWDHAAADYAEAIRLSPQTLGWQNTLAWLLATCPDPLIRNPRRAVALARQAVAGAPGDEGAWNTLGVAHYRAGDWKAAVEALDKSVELRHGGDAYDWYFLAMAFQRLGNTDEARRWFDKAAQWREEHVNGNEDLQRFEAEAKELLTTQEREP
jgi:tetratricopeptide (TPR) repeat protein